MNAQAILRSAAVLAVAYISFDFAQKATEQATIMPALFGLFGVLVGGLINVWVQSLLMNNATNLAEAKATQERQLAENRAKLEIGNTFVQWQLKQLSELYGPLRALLGQSNAIYRQMNQALVKADDKRFRLTDRQDELDKYVFEINLTAMGWVRFRTVLHIGEVYGKDFGIEDYFDEVVAIGGRMVKIIEEKAGYARPNQNELLSVFGNYLAHYAILSRIHRNLKEVIQTGKESKAAFVERPNEMKINESAVFPQNIQKLVVAGFESINTELNEWRAKAAA